MNLDERLREQNAIAGWRDCEAAGLTHQPVLSRAQYVGREPVAVYVPCRRCPVWRRSTLKGA